MRISILTLLVILCVAPAAMAQDTPADIRGGAWKSMSVEERRDALHNMKEKRQNRREEWKNLSAEERAAKKAAAKEKWNNLTPEQKEKAKQVRQNHMDRKNKRLERRMDRVNGR